MSDRWISIDDNLPEFEGWYLTAFEPEDIEELGYLNKAYETMIYTNSLGDYIWEGSEPADDGCRVSHWMPLPEPPSNV